MQNLLSIQITSIPSTSQNHRIDEGGLVRFIHRTTIKRMKKVERK